MEKFASLRKKIAKNWKTFQKKPKFLKVMYNFSEKGLREK